MRTASETCLVVSGISYAAAPEGALDDASNRYDTPETVKQVEAHNLVFERLCPEPR